MSPPAPFLSRKSTSAFVTDQEKSRAIDSIIKNEHNKIREHNEQVMDQFSYRRSKRLIQQCIGIYLLREEHVIKMTTPDFVVYY